MLTLKESHTDDTTSDTWVAVAQKQIHAGENKLQRTVKERRKILRRKI